MEIIRTPPYFQLEPYMTENYILTAFRTMGEHPQAVKLMRNKYTGEAAGYCFVNFLSDEQAIDAMHKLNGKPIPGTNPVVRFRLNSASNNVSASMTTIEISCLSPLDFQQNKVLGPMDREFSVWVGDLSAEVDDYSLYKAFAMKYNSIRSAKVILDGQGFSKGYGFVRFGMEEEQRSALFEMTGYLGLGTKALKICNAVPKPKGSDLPPEPPVSATTIVQNAFAAAAAAAQPDYSQYYDPSAAYWQSAYSNYYYDQPGAATAAAPSQQDLTAASNYYQQQTGTQWATMYPQEDDDMALVEHKRELDVDAYNREALDSDRNLYDALESSKWLPIEQLEAF